MGIDYQTFRQRIGLHAARVARARNAGRWVFTSPQHQLCVRLGLCFLLMMAGAIACLSCSYLVTLDMSSRVLSSNFACSLGQALSGKGMHTPLNMTLSIPPSTLAGYSRDLSALLLLSGIEPNPGPDMNADDIEIRLQEIRANIREDTKREIENCLTPQMSAITSQLTVLMENVRKIGNDVAAMKVKVAEQDKEIARMKEAHEETMNKLDGTERQLEIMEQQNRRNNILLHGIAEDEGESAQVCEKKAIDSINKVIPGLLDEGSMARVHRVGKKISGKDRPVLLQLLQSADKSAILGAREEYKKRNLGVTSDLTRQQRDLIAEARSEGKIGFFRGGQFHTKPMQRAGTSHRDPSRINSPDNSGHSNGVRRSCRQSRRR